MLAIADALEAATGAIVAANERDLQQGVADGLNEGLLDRLRLDPARVAAIAAAVRDVAVLPDPVGEVVRGSTLPNGLRLRQLRVPMGVVAMVYEARPNVTVDAAVLALKSGNAAVLRGGSAALNSNLLLVQVMREALVSAGLPADAISSVDEHGRDGVATLMTARGLVDLLIPRGGAGLIQTVVQNATVPVIETGTGNCHVYVDASADLEQALAITMNSKTRRTSVCNAAETLLVHADVAAAFLPKVLAELAGAGVRLHADAGRRRPGRGGRGRGDGRDRGRLGRASTSTSTWPWPSCPPWTPRSSTSVAGPRVTPRRSSPPTCGRPTGSPPRSTRPSWPSTPRRRSPTARSSAWVQR